MAKSSNGQKPNEAKQVLDTMGTSTTDPGFIWGIVGLALFFFIPVVGLPISAIGYSRSKKAGYKNDVALIGLIMNAVVTGLIVLALVTVIGIALIAAAAG